MIFIGKQEKGSKALTTRPTRILLVSNDANHGVLMDHLLSQIKNSTYIIERAESLKEGIRLISRNSCDVVLLNYFWDSFKIGGRFLRKAKSINSTLPVIVFSAENETIVEQQIINLGAADYLTLNELNTRTLGRSIHFAQQRKNIEQRLEHLANYDFLTQLPNRMLFQDRLQQFMRMAEREYSQFALILVNLNNLKQVNDHSGYEVGDALLKAFAQRLNRTIRRNDTIARIGDDEFGLLFNRVNNQALAQQLVYKILQEIREPVIIDGQRLTLQCSIGIAIYTSNGTDMDTLKRQADIALHHAKLDEPNSYCFYSPTLQGQGYSQEDINHDFISALANNQIGLYFNPRIDTQTERISAIEVNPYWDHPQRGLLEYESFNWRQLDPTMSSRFIEWLLSTSLEYFKQLSVTPATKLIFNIDFKDLLFPSFSLMVSSKLKRYDINGHQIEFDISNMHNDHHSYSMLSLCITDLQRLGISFGMNGFGSDNLPLLQLDAIPLSVLKLDKRFIAGLQSDKHSLRSLIGAFVDFAHKLDKKIAIEGKHYEIPINTIRSLGIDYYKSIFSVELDAIGQMQSLLESNANTESLIQRQ